MGQEEFKSMMERIEASNAGQEKYARKQYRMSQITALASILVLAVVLYTAVVLIPKVNVTYQNMQLILENMKVITTELAEADLNQMIEDVDQLVVSSETNINEAMEKINAIDIEKLNAAIEGLSEVVEPFAKFFGKFR
ncbi:MAG: hypothetical protein ACI39W_03095 [Brotaphodocola sp.]